VPSGRGGSSGEGGEAAGVARGEEERRGCRGSEREAASQSPPRNARSTPQRGARRPAKAPPGQKEGGGRCGNTAAYSSSPHQPVPTRRDAQPPTPAPRGKEGDGPAQAGGPPSAAGAGVGNRAPGAERRRARKGGEGAGARHACRQHRRSRPTTEETAPPGSRPSRKDRPYQGRGQAGAATTAPGAAQPPAARPKRKGGGAEGVTTASAAPAGRQKRQRGAANSMPPARAVSGRAENSRQDPEITTPAPQQAGKGQGVQTLSQAGRGEGAHRGTGKPGAEQPKGAAGKRREMRRVRREAGIRTSAGSQGKGQWTSGQTEPGKLSARRLQEAGPQPARRGTGAAPTKGKEKARRSKGTQNMPATNAAEERKRARAAGAAHGAAQKGTGHANPQWPRSTQAGAQAPARARSQKANLERRRALGSRGAGARTASASNQQATDGARRQKWAWSRVSGAAGGATSLGGPPGQPDKREKRKNARRNTAGVRRPRCGAEAGMKAPGTGRQAEAEERVARARHPKPRRRESPRAESAATIAGGEERPVNRPPPKLRRKQGQAADQEEPASKRGTKGRPKVDSRKTGTRAGTKSARKSECGKSACQSERQSSRKSSQGGAAEQAIVAAGRGTGRSSRKAKEALGRLNATRGARGAKARKPAAKQRRPGRTARPGEKGGKRAANTDRRGESAKHGGPAELQQVSRPDARCKRARATAARRQQCRADSKSRLDRENGMNDIEGGR